MALLVGYGAAVVNPYLAFETIEELLAEGEVRDLEPQHAVRNYLKACTKGVLKVMSKMGISHAAELPGARRSSRRSVSTRPSSTAASPGRPRASAESASTLVAEEVVRRTREGLRGTLAARTTSSTRAASTSGAATASTTCSIRRRSSSCSTPAAATAAAVYREYAELVNDQSRQRGDAARPAGAEAGRRANPDRRGGAGRGDLPSASRPAPCRTARSAPRRTRRWPSP